MNWEKIKGEYLQGGISQRKLAEKHGISYNTLRRRADKETWFQQREDIERRSAAKATQNIINHRAKDIASLNRSRAMLIAKLEDSISMLPDIPGNRVEQIESEIVGDIGDESLNRGSRKRTPKQKTVKFESDLLKMVATLDKLMELTSNDGYAEQRKINRERLEIERERLELEKERVELEREKLSLQRNDPNPEDVNAQIIALADLLNNAVADINIEDIDVSPNEEEGSLPEQ